MIAWLIGVAAAASRGMRRCGVRPSCAAEGMAAGAGLLGRGAAIDYALITSGSTRPPYTNACAPMSRA